MPTIRALTLVGLFLGSLAAAAVSSDEPETPGPGSAAGQYPAVDDMRDAPRTGTPQLPRGAQPAPGWTRPVLLTVRLIDQTEKARRGEAAVEVQVDGMTIMDPAEAREPVPGQGHLHYKVDDGPVIATTVNKLSFHQLTPGRHVIEVTPAGNDHKPVGPTQRVEITTSR